MAYPGSVRIGGALLLALYSCNAVYGLEQTRLPDAPVDADCTLVTPDEDHDCIANDADNCPGIADSTQADADADGVGDVCDPRPMVAGDRMVTFQSFDDPASGQQQWHDMEQAGMWLFEAGQVRRDDVADLDSALEITEPVTLDAFTIQMAFRVDAIPASTVYRHYEILIDHPAGALSSGHTCIVSRVPSTAVGVADAQLLESYPSQEGNQGLIDDPPPGSTVIIELTRRADIDIRCALRIDDTIIALGKVPRSVAWPRTGYFSLYIRNVAISVLWTTLYTQ
jgi:hypothetical protein